jgi:hypothetical protein
MPITFDCPECGKPCRAPAEMAGRKAKCQDCKAIITVPAEEEQVADKPLPKRKAVPTVADDEDDEKPRAKKSRKDDDDEEEDKPRARKSRKDDDDEEEDEKPRKKKSRRDDEDEDDDDRPRVKKSRKDDDEDEDDDKPAKKKRQYHDEDDSPRKKTKAKKKKSGSGMGLILMLGGAALALLVLCGGGGALAWWLWLGAASEMAFVPDDCTEIRMIHISQMENSSAYKAFTNQDQNAVKEFTATPGNFDAIKQAGVDSVFSASSSEGEVNVIKTKKDITDADLVKGRNYKDVKAGKYALHEGTLESVCLVNSTTVVYSTKPALLKKVLERGKAPELSAGMKKALGYTNRSKSVAKARVKSNGVGGGGGMILPFGVDMTQGVECAGGFMQFDSEIHFEDTTAFKDAQSAEAAKKKTEDDIKKLVDNLDAAFKLLGKGNADNPMKEMFQSIHVTVSGSEVHVEATWSSDLIERVAKAQNDLKGGIGGKPGPGGKPR